MSLITFNFNDFSRYNKLDENGKACLCVICFCSSLLESGDETIMAVFFNMMNYHVM